MEKNYIPQFEVIFDELVLPEWLNGKELSFLNLNISGSDNNHVIETCRCYQSLYDVICSARFNLACACRNEYPELLDPANPQLSHIWMRSQFVNNAILWYNAAFDLSLQPLWIYYKMYAKTKQNLSLTTKTLEKILETCRFDNLKKNSPKELGDYIIPKLDGINSNMQGNIKMWANTLKHRKKIEYIELSKKDHPIAVGGKFTFVKDEKGNRTVMMSEGEYNSSKTIQRVVMADVICTLISFHKELIPVTKEIYDQINM